jgi:hypothetical protein
MKSIRTLLGLLLVASAGPALAESLNLGPHGILTLDLPPGWTLTRQGAETPGGPAFRIEPPAGDQLTLLVTPMPVPSGSDGKAVARQAAEQVADHFKSMAVESSLPLQPIDGATAHGYYVSMTDKNVTQPTATDFKHADQGAIALGPVVLSFTVLSNAPDRPERAQALDIVRNAGYTKPIAPVSPRH